MSGNSEVFVPPPSLLHRIQWNSFMNISTDQFGINPTKFDKQESFFEKTLMNPLRKAPASTLVPAIWKGIFQRVEQLQNRPFLITGTLRRVYPLGKTIMVSCEEESTKFFSMYFGVDILPNTTDGNTVVYVPLKQYQNQSLIKFKISNELLSTLKDANEEYGYMVDVPVVIEASGSTFANFPEEGHFGISLKVLKINVKS